MSAKPYHAGHDGLVRIAARECDIVELFVSLSDRKRPGEMPILGSAMEQIWREYLEPSLPDNVHVTYGGAPVGNMYKLLGSAEEQGSEDTFVIYSDVEDIKIYTDEVLSRYIPRLLENGQIVRRGVERTETVPVSGTKMRAFLQSGDVENFVAYLPAAVRQYGQEITHLLRNRR